MKNPTDLGMNRTGIDVSPIDSKQTLAEAQRTPPSSPGNVTNLLTERSVFHKAADAIGSVPPPGTLKGMAKAGMKKLGMLRPEVFIDKLGERLAFERTGTRLYEALINKCEARGENLSLLPITELKRFRDEEHRHFLLVTECMRKLGADPTAVTPCADIAGVEATGLVQVLTDPRTSISQSIQAILVAELADHDGWEGLITLAKLMNEKEMGDQFQVALDEETVHLETTRRIYADLVRADAEAA